MPDAPPRAGSWEEWGRAVLGDLADLKETMRDAKLESSRVALELALLKERSASVVAFEKRLGALEQAVETAEDRVNTYRKILGAVSLTLLGTIALPIIRAWATVKGSGGP